MPIATMIRRSAETRHSSPCRWRDVVQAPSKPGAANAAGWRIGGARAGIAHGRASRVTWYAAGRKGVARAAQRVLVVGQPATG